MQVTIYEIPSTPTDFSLPDSGPWDSNLQRDEHLWDHHPGAVLWLYKLCPGVEYKCGTVNALAKFVECIAAGNLLEVSGVPIRGSVV